MSFLPSFFRVCRWPTGLSVLAAAALLFSPGARGEADLAELGSFEALPLRPFLEQVLEANLMLEVEREARAVAADQARAEWGLFEPRWVSSAGRDFTNRENTRQQLLSQGRSFFEDRSTVAETAVEARLPTGAQVRAGGQIQRIRNNLAVVDRPEYITGVGVSVTQPLLKDAGWDANFARMRAARSDSEAAFQDLRRETMGLLSQAEAAYWGLYEALAEYRLRKESSGVARQILEDNEARVEAGRMTDMDVLQARAALAIRETQLEGAREEVREWAALIAGFTGRVLDANDPLPLPSEATADLNLSGTTGDRLARARAFHPVYLQREAEWEASGQRRILARNQRLPELNLRGSWGLSGYGDAWRSSGDTLFEPGTRNWFVGVELNVPLFGGVRERAGRTIGERQWRQAELAVQAVEVELGNRLRALEGRVSSLARQVQSYAQAVDFSEAVLENELASLDVGRGDSRRVFEAEEDLTRARLLLLESRMRFQRGLIDLAVTTGTYLLDKGLDPGEE